MEGRDELMEVDRVLCRAISDLINGEDVAVVIETLERETGDWKYIRDPSTRLYYRMAIDWLVSARNREDDDDIGRAGDLDEGEKLLWAARCENYRCLVGMFLEKRTSTETPL